MREEQKIVWVHIPPEQKMQNAIVSECERLKQQIQKYDEEVKALQKRLKLTKRRRITCVNRLSEFNNGK